VLINEMKREGAATREEREDKEEEGKEEVKMERQA
jgi:hypothetical protein